MDNDNDGKIKKNINRVRQLRKIIKTEHPELVLSFMGRQNYRMYLASYGIDVKKIISVRNDPKIEYGRGIKKIIANKVFESMDGCVFQTHEAQKYFTPKLVAKSKVIINGLGDIFYEQKYNPDAKNIVSIGMLESKKNFKMLIDAFGEIEELFPEEKLIIFGEGYLEEQLKSYIKKKKYEKKIILAGITQNVPQKLSESKLFVMSSDYEGMPNALMEAMAVGLPCICTDCPCGGPRELMRDGMEGYLVECGNVKQMAEKMKMLLEDRNLRIKIGENAKLRAQKFRAKTVYAMWEDYLFFSEEN